MSWKAIPSIGNNELAPSRLELHHAAQIPAILARSFLGLHHEDINANLGWEERFGALVSCPIPVGREELKVGLVLEKLELILWKENIILRFPFKGRTWGEAWKWINESLHEFGLDPSKIDMQQPYAADLPKFPTQEGANFEFAKPEVYSYFAAFYANAQHLLSEVLAKSSEASEIRCWPHHFDMASLLDLGEGKSIGVGMSPGDGTSEIPYFYITPWPYPDTSKVDLPSLSAGKWHTKGWVGAVLTASDLLEVSHQEEILRNFIEEAIMHSRALLS